MKNKKTNQQMDTPDLNRQESDLLMLKVMKQGDYRAFEFLFKRYYRFLTRIIFKYTANLEEAEELSSDIFQKIWDKRETIHIEKDLKNYLSFSGRNTALNFLRSKKIYLVELDMNLHDQKAAGSSILPDGKLNLYDTEQEVNKVIEQLPSKCREIFKLNKLHAYTVAEIAALLGLSERTVSNNLTHANQIIRKNFQN
ncbi:RNA polymerase sigma factor [Mucilaginibacter paludis]|uniref:RNA polymerase, sigma-24 subunit, ECF subfamily n=1 Tax=Mucilaginibacter paludis DSM 18603 TaxID=714943 RepID=H1Y923_9SPHI|nr:sigma-70 family RNA polymerase sigma factor [Mucilaginibacter paludis]EHQ29061.1 RNA polymerase, sigma-24 subunit, ECF subfamily [Mucilaginibacter paludis DSM 18603]